jgi:electron transfer flavoprotein alpha/beta subunit
MLKRVFVCLSQTLLTSGQLDILESEKIISQQGEPKPAYRVNPADRCALEMALEFRTLLGVEVVALTFTPPKDIAVLRMALATGVDRCVHLVHPTGALIDGWVAAKMIANYLGNSLKTTDLILCGDSRADTRGAQVGPFIAEWLNLPQITQVVSSTCQPGDDSIEAVRLLERGNRQRILCTLPALATVSRFGSPGSYIAVLSELQAPTNRIEVIEANPVEAGIQPLSQIKSFSRPRPRTKKVSAPNTKLSAADRMKFLMSGGQAKKESSLIEGSPEDAADRIISYLQENNLID